MASSIEGLSFFDIVIDEAYGKPNNLKLNVRCKCKVCLLKYSFILNSLVLK